MSDGTPLRLSLDGRSSARSLLLTVLGEYVLPSGHSTWTSTLVRALAALGVEEKACRQALANMARAGWISRERRGRSVKWYLTDDGRSLLEEGSERIYSFDPVRSGWDGHWLVVLISVPEERRPYRHVLRTRLAWAGFGSLGQGAWVSPLGSSREKELAGILGDLGDQVKAISFIAELGSLTDPSALVRQAWDIEFLDNRYRAFIELFRSAPRTGPEEAFVTKSWLVHEWRRFPLLDPGIPAELLPVSWNGGPAAELFHKLYDELSSDAAAWFAGLDEVVP